MAIAQNPPCHCEPPEGRRSNLTATSEIASGASRPRNDTGASGCLQGWFCSIANDGFAQGAEHAEQTQVGGREQPRNPGALWLDRLAERTFDKEIL